MPLAAGSTRDTFRRAQATMAVKLNSGAATLTRDHTVTQKSTALPLSSLELSGAHGDGATALTLQGPAAVAIEGTLPAAIVLTIDGSEYTVASEATVSGNLISCTVSPGLDGAKSDGDTVALATSTTLTWPRSRVHHLDTDERLSLRSFGNVTWALRLAANDAPTGGVPARDDRATVGSRTGRVREVQEPPGAWRCLMEA